MQHVRNHIFIYAPLIEQLRSKYDYQKTFILETVQIIEYKRPKDHSIGPPYDLIIPFIPPTSLFII